MVNREHAQDWPVRAAHALSGWAAGATCWCDLLVRPATCGAGCANNPEFLEDPVIGVKYKTSSSAIMGLLLGVALLGTPPLGLCSANGFWRGIMACRVRACPCAYP